MSFSTYFTTGEVSLELIVWSLFLGIVLGAFSSFYVKRILGSFVRKLLEKGARTPESALTLAQAGLSANPFVRFALRDKSTYRKIVIAVDQPELEGQKGSAKLAQQRFFIPESLTDRADSIFTKNGNGILPAILAVILFFIVALVSFIVIPWITDMLMDLYDLVAAMNAR